jgi:hypothetical protein
MSKLFLLCVALILASFIPSFGQKPDQPKRGPSTPEEREKALASIDDLETNPLGPKAHDEREWLLYFLVQVPDIHVSMCSGVFADLPKGNKKDSDILFTQVLYSSARYAIQHDGGSSNAPDQYLAGVEGALRTYEVLIQQKPEDRQTKVDDLLKKRADGTLADWVKQRAATSCKNS